jgi:hypothetical protein
MGQKLSYLEKTRARIAPPQRARIKAEIGEP